MSDHFMGNHILTMYQCMFGLQKQQLQPWHQQQMELDLVILPPDDGNLSEEEQIDGNNDTLPADVAGQVEVHEYDNESDGDDEMHLMMMSYNH